MTKPNLSPNFTMDDLYKLREYNSLRHKIMTTYELNIDLNKDANIILERITQIKKEKELSVY